MKTSRTLILFILSVYNIFSINNTQIPSAWDNEKNGSISLDTAKNSLKILSKENLKDNNKVIILLPTIYIDIQKYLAKQLSKKYCVIMMFYRKKNRDLSYLGYNYHRYKKYNKTAKPFAFKQPSFDESLWDFLELDSYIPKNTKRIYFITNLSLEQMLINDHMYRMNIEHAIIFFPNFFYLEDTFHFFKNSKNLLWVGGKYDKFRLNKYIEKYGGEQKVYQKSGYSYQIFYRNFNIQKDLINWIENKIKKP